MSSTTRYAKIVAWSEADGCYVGTCPGLLHGGCHGDDEQAVFAELCQIVQETVDLLEEDQLPLPPPTAHLEWSRFVPAAPTSASR